MLFRSRLSPSRRIMRFLKSRLLVLVIALTPRATLCAQRASAAVDSGGRGGATERTLFALEDRWARALIARDRAFFERTLASSYLYTDERGVFTKAQVIAEQTAPGDTVSFAANDSMRARVHGNAAVVVGLLTVRGRGAQGAFAHRYRFTDAWARVGGRWVMIASQDYDIPSSR